MHLEEHNLGRVESPQLISIHKQDEISTEVDD